MDNLLPSTYLLILVLLLAIAGAVVLRQILRTRTTEKQLSKLQSKLAQEKGTAQEYYELGSIYLKKQLFNQAAIYFKKALKSKALPLQHPLNNDGRLPLRHSCLRPTDHLVDSIRGSGSSCTCRWKTKANGGTLPRPLPPNTVT